MKINYRTCPILKRLEDKDLGSLKFPQELLDDQPFLDTIYEVFEENATDFARNIDYITAPFMKAVITAMPKFASLFKNTEELNPLEILDILNQPSLTGTLINHDEIHLYKITQERTILYEFWYDRDHGRILLICYYDSAHIEHSHTIVYEDYLRSPVYHMTQLLRVEFIQLFKKYAQVEVKYLPPKLKPKDAIHKNTNSTNCGVTILNSKWFTTLVKSDAFKVSGHFRLQPKKDASGEWTKELIWINEFIKTGYTSPARKLVCEKQ